MAKSIRPCPLCAGNAALQYFPWKISFEDELYEYYRCGVCGTVYVDPIPSEQTFARIYAGSVYHENFYCEPSGSSYLRSAEILSTFAQYDALVLDYGCGAGDFISCILSRP